MHESDPTPEARFIRAYLYAALLFCSDDSDEPLARNYTTADLAPEAMESARADCKKFIADNKADLDSAASHDGYSYSSAGHDFWLNRNGHGAGFWDRDLGDAGVRLDAASEKVGEVDLYVGDDGKLYF